MSKFIMIIGLPASGKSTVAKQLKEEEGYVIHSSDELRIELFGDVNEQEKNEELFKELDRRIIKDLSKGKDVIFDATNLSAKKRKFFLSKLPKGTVKIAKVVATPIGTCLARDVVREKQVGRGVIIRMHKSFNFPVKGEGFDDIELIMSEYSNSFIDRREYYEGVYAMCHKYDQKSNYHSLTLSDHMYKATSLYFSYFFDKEDYDECIVEALRLHDIGKPFTQSFKDKKGNRRDTASYIGHENVSAYEAMFCVCNELGVGGVTEVCQLIQYHMKPYNLESEKSKRKLLDLLGEVMYNKVMLMNRYDRLAH